MSILRDLPDAEYRAARALSYSGAKTLMRSPALFEYELVHGRPDKTEFDVGHAAHTKLLGVGDPVELVQIKVEVDGEQRLVPVENYNRKAAQQEAARIRAAGGVPVTLPQLEAVDAMVSAIRSHPLAGKLLEPGRGWAETSIFWDDPETGTANKGRLDWLIVEDDDGRPRVVDPKTCTDVRRWQLRKHIADMRYHWQGPHYVDGGLAAHAVEDAAWSWVFVEKTPPHLVRVVEPDAEMWAAGARFMAEARRRYARWLEDGAPVDYPTADLFGLPPFAATHPEDQLP